jgi:hypothetical protein
MWRIFTRGLWWTRTPRKVEIQIHNILKIILKVEAKELAV